MKTLLVAVALAAAAVPGAAIGAAKCHEPWQAAMDGNVDGVRACLDVGMPLTVTDDHGNTILMYAALFGQGAVVELLLERGAKANAQNDNDETALMHAASKGDVRGVRALLAHGANVGLKTRSAGVTALGIAQGKGFTEVVAALRAAGARTLVRGQLYDKLNSAVSLDSARQVREVLEQGADADFDPYLLSSSAWSGKADVVTALLDYGASIDAASAEFGTPLQAAAETAHVDVVRLLLARGANVNAVDKNGWTPLRGAQAMRQKDDLDAATAGQLDEIIGLLRAAGAR